MFHNDKVSIEEYIGLISLILLLLLFLSCVYHRLSSCPLMMMMIWIHLKRIGITNELCCCFFSFKAFDDHHHQKDDNDDDGT